MDRHIGGLRVCIRHRVVCREGGDRSVADLIVCVFASLERCGKLDGCQVRAGAALASRKTGSVGAGVG